MNDEAELHNAVPGAGRGGARPGAGRKSNDAKDEKRRRKTAERMAQLIFGGIEKRLVATGGDKWKADDDERNEITEAAGDIVFDLIEDYPHYLRLCIALGAYVGGRAEMPKMGGGGGWREWFKNRKLKDDEAENGKPA